MRTMRGSSGVLLLAVLVGCGKGSISGTVKNVAGQAVSGASVRTTPTTYAPVTGSDGKYSIEKMERQIYTVTASSSGYADAIVTVNLDDTKNAGVDLTLGATGGGTITGVVKNSAGQPISGAVVQTSPASQQVSSDAAGIYAIKGAAFQTYTVTASKAGYSAVSIPVALTPTASSVTQDLTLRIGASGSVTLLMNQAFSFASGVIVSSTSAQADVVFLPPSGSGSLLRPLNGAGIQVVGRDAPLDAVGSVPTSGYSTQDLTILNASGGPPIFVAEGAIVAVKTGSGIYAKIRITYADMNNTPGSVAFEWAYQSAGGVQFSPGR